jgi:FG-GAP-like repeat
MTTTPRLVKSLTQVNTSDAAVAPGRFADQFNGQIAALPDGGYVVVWMDQSGTHNPDGAAVVGQRYDSAGNKVGGEVYLTPTGSENQYLPAVAVLPNGNIAVAFVDRFDVDLDNNIYVRVFDSALNFIRVDVIDTGTNGTVDPSLTAFGNGNYAVSYTVGSGADTDIVGRIVTSATGVVGAQFDIDNGTDNRHFSQLATLSNGNFVAVYQDENAGSATDTDIYYGIFTNTGTSLFVHDAVPGGAFGGGAETDPDVAALRDGGFVVVWTDADTATTEIRASIISNANIPVTSNIVVNTTTTGAQNNASVVALADGGFLVTWEDDNVNLVRAQRFDAAGNKIGLQFTVKFGISGDTPEAALLTDGSHFAYAVGDVSGDADVMTSIWRTRDVSHDFDGDGKSGVLWRHDSGQVYFWEMDGLAVKSEGSVAHAPVPSDWHIQGAGDFDGDGNNDILWRHDSGQVYFWEMNGLGISAEGGVAHAPVPNDWHVQGVGDFDADGKSDILWRHDSGQVYFWEMDGLTIKAEGSVAHAPVPNDWHIQGLGDFDGDGKSDLLWRHDSGQVYFWEMNGLAIKAEGGVAHAAVPNDWHIQGIGDFDGDGKSDILWRHDSGQVYIWEMNGLAIKAEGGVAHAPVGNDWHVQDIGDYDADGKSDILWRHDSGQVYFWEMNGLAIKAEGGAPHAPVPSDWHIFSQYNFV